MKRSLINSVNHTKELVFYNLHFWKYLLISLILISLNTFVYAADISISNNNSATTINIDGDLVPGDGDKFSLIASKVQKAKVVLNSNGGNLLSGIQIGTVIREKGFSTTVLPNNICASSCGLIWYSGTPKYLSSKALIGFHSAYTIENGMALENGVGNAIVGAYLTKLGASYETIIFFTEASPGDINWLTQPIANKLRVSFVDPANGQYMPEIAIPQGAEIYATLNSVEKKALKITTSYFEMMMKDKESSRYFLQAILDANVVSNNVFRSKTDIVFARLSDFHKWRSRAFEIIPESLIIDCAGIRSCEISGKFTWVGITSFYEYGTGNFEFYIDFTKNKPYIFGDTISFD